MSETRVAKKLCNCFVADAEADPSKYALAMRLLGVDAAAVEVVLRRFQTVYGGLWVGGSVELTTQPLTFRPNVVNRAVHRGDYSFSVPLSEITSVTYEPGFLTVIVVVTTRHGRFKLRCFAARRFRGVLNRTRAAA